MLKSVQENQIKVPKVDNESITIEELHNLIVNQEIDLNKYYEELFDEVDFQQKRLNAFL